MADMMPFGFHGASGGMLTLPVPEMVPPGQWVDLYNCVVDGGTVTLRPGLNIATTVSFTNINTVLGSLNLPVALVVDTSPSGVVDDLVYYTWGTTGVAGVSRVEADGSNSTLLFSYSTVRRAIDLDTVASPNKIIIGGSTEILSGNSDGSGALSTIITKAGGDIQALKAWPSASRIYYTNKQASSSDNGIWRATTTGASDTRMKGDSTVPVNTYSCLALDQVNGYLYVGVYSVTGTPTIKNIRRYTVTGSETNSAFVASEQIVSIEARPIAMHYDAADERLYWIEYDGTSNYDVKSGIPGIYGGSEFFPPAFGFADQRTHYRFTSTDAPSSIFSDSSQETLYLARNIASTGSIVRTSSSDTIRELVWWKRSLIGVAEASIGDFALMQIANTTTGNSNFAVWETASDEALQLTPGYTRGTAADAPDLFVMISRTANPSSTDPILNQGDFSRISSAYMGGGLDSNQGGILLGTTQGAYVFNYRAPEESTQNEQQLIYFVGAPTGGTFRLILNSSDTGDITYSTNSTTLASNIQTALNTLLGASSVTVSTTNFPNIYDSTSASPIAVEFTGNGYNDRGLPFLRPGTTALTGGAGMTLIVRRSNDITTKGRSYPYGIYWLRPAGLPTPAAAPTLGVSSSGPLTGYYEYAISYYSSQLKLESPLSPLATVSPSSQFVDVSWTLPSTHYFTNTFSTPRFDGGPVIDKVRVWRRRLGNSSSDTTGRDSFYYLVEEVPANCLALKDRRSEAGTNPLDRGRIYVTKAYPPANAQYVEVHESHAYYASGEPGSRLLYVSEGPFVGGVSGNEDGYEYVRAESYYFIDDKVANDNQITALKSYGPQLIVWTDESCFAVDASDVDNSGIAVRQVENAPGCASHWCVVESAPLSDLPGGALFYPHPKGSIYVFDGARAETSGRVALRDYIDTFSQVTWKPETLNTVLNRSWYYATAEIDPRGNRILLTAPLADGSRETYVYSLDDKAWSRWNVSAGAMVLGREPSATAAVPLGGPVVYVTTGATVSKFEKGTGDNGAPFSWHALTGKLHAEQPWTGKTWGNGIAIVRTIAGDNATTMTVDAYIDDTLITTTSQLLPAGSGTIPFSAHSAIGRYCQLKFSGSHMDDYEYPRILGYYVWQAPAGVDGRVIP